jgi:hypothetical protein
MCPYGNVGERVCDLRQLAVEIMTETMAKISERSLDFRLVDEHLMAIAWIKGECAFNTNLRNPPFFCMIWGGLM